VTEQFGSVDRRSFLLYAIFLDWPSRKSAIGSLGTNATDATIERVELLGGPELQFRREGDALYLTLPGSPSEAFAPVLRIRGRGLA